LAQQLLMGQGLIITSLRHSTLG